MKEGKQITEDEAALYDRQIRLWGVDAQKKLLASRVLLVNVQGLGAEIAKNLVLGGINSLTLLDSNQVQEEDLKYNFLIQKESLNKNRAEACTLALQTLNPLVKIQSDPSSAQSKDETFYEQFDVVCALSNDLNELEYIDNKCRQKNVMFLAGFVTGLFGFAFIDFGEFNYLVEAPKISGEENEAEKGENKSKSSCGLPKAKSAETEKLELQQKTIKYLSFNGFVQNLKKPTENVSAVRIKRLSKAYFLFLVFNGFYQTHKRPFSASSDDDRAELIKIKTELFDQLKINQELLPETYFAQSQLVEFTPVNAIMGGIMAQEVIKAITKKNDPVNNFFVFDGDLMSGEVISIQNV